MVFVEVRLDPSFPGMAFPSPPEATRAPFKTEGGHDFGGQNGGMVCGSLLLADPTSSSCQSVNI